MLTSVRAEVAHPLQCYQQRQIQIRSTAQNRIDYFVRHFSADSNRSCPLSQLFPLQTFLNISSLHAHATRTCSWLVGDARGALIANSTKIERSEVLNFEALSNVHFQQPVSVFRTFYA